MSDLDTFCETHNITIECHLAAGNPNMEKSSLGPHATHWKIYLSRDGLESMDTPFSQGSAHKVKPSPADVLSCLLIDSSALDHDSFESWASDLGYDGDSRIAESTFNICCELGHEVKEFLGPLYSEAREQEH